MGCGGCPSTFTVERNEGGVRTGCVLAAQGGNRHRLHAACLRTFLCAAVRCGAVVVCGVALVGIKSALRILKGGRYVLFLLGVVWRCAGESCLMLLVVGGGNLLRVGWVLLLFVLLTGFSLVCDHCYVVLC